MAYSTPCESYKNRDAIALQVEVDCPMDLNIFWRLHRGLSNFL